MERARQSGKSATFAGAVKMSERTPCCYCVLKRMKARAKKDGNKIILRKSPRMLGGTDVYVIPKGVKIPKGIQGPSEKFPNGDDFHREYAKAWMMQISDRCVC